MDEQLKPIHIMHYQGSTERPEGVTGRQVSINANVFSVYLSSDDDKETIEFLTEKALYILDKLKEADR